MKYKHRLKLDVKFDWMPRRIVTVDRIWVGSENDSNQTFTISNRTNTQVRRYLNTVKSLS